MGFQSSSIWLAGDTTYVVLTSACIKINFAKQEPKQIGKSFEPDIGESVAYY